MYTYGWFMLRFDKKQQNSVKQLLFIKKKNGLMYVNSHRPNCGRGICGNSNLLQKDLCTHCCIQGLWPRSRPLLTHASTKDSRTIIGKSGSVSCGDTAPISWLLVLTRFCLCPLRVCWRKSCGSSIIKLQNWAVNSPNLKATQMSLNE